MSISVMLTLTDKYYEIDSEAPLTEMFDRCDGNSCHPIFKKVPSLTLDDFKTGGSLWDIMAFVHSGQVLDQHRVLLRIDGVSSRLVVSDAANNLCDEFGRTLVPLLGARFPAHRDASYRYRYRWTLRIRPGSCRLTKGPDR